MKKILLIHNLYRDFGGEDAAFSNEENLLKQNYEVDKIVFDNKQKLNFYDLINFIFLTNIKSNKILRKRIENFNPDIVYIHNLWFKGSLGLLGILKNSDIPVVIKIHNFRYLCTNTYFSKKHLKDYDFCPACGVEKSIFFNKYFKDSFIKSLFVIRFSKKLYKSLKNSKFRLALLTNHHKEILIKNEFIEDQLFVFPNYISTINNSENLREKQFLYAGRVSVEKGVEELIASFLSLSIGDYCLKIIGTGPELKRLKTKYSNKNIIFSGFIKNEDVLKEIQHSAVVVSATKLYEGQPTLLCEASLNSIPAIFPNSGGISEFLPENYKFLFQQYNYEELKKTMLKIIKSDLNKIGNENKIFTQKIMDRENLLEIFSLAVENK
jgi:glycosyltransferase involved in cell wall biosynthesis